MKPLRYAAALAVLASVLALGLAQDKAPESAEKKSPLAPNIDSITLQDIKRDVHFLAGDEMRGRETLSAEARVTTGYVRTRMEQAGVKPGAANGIWYQDVGFRYRAWEKKPALSIKVGEEVTALEYEKDFVSATGAGATTDLKEVPVVFAGYAIRDRQQEYDDITGLDLKGKFAIVLRFAPSGWSREGRRSPFIRGGSIFNKQRQCREAGALGILMVTGPASLGGTDTDRNLPSPSNAEKSPPLELALGDPRESTRLPFFHLTESSVDRMLGGEGKLKALQEEFDKKEFGGRPDLKDVRVNLSMQTKVFSDTCRNVIGRIDGELDEWIVIGAHHDHLGLGYFGSRDNPRNHGQVHNGADDNATGVAAVLEVAEAIAQSGRKPRRGFLFMTFTGEEKGLLGARWYVQHPVVANEKVVTMLNIDMIGRAVEKKMQIIGTASSKLLDRVCKEAAPTFPELTFTYSTRLPLGGSDHAPFFGTAGIPALFFHSGLNELYHTSLDDPETINFEDMVPAIKMLYEVAWRVSEDPAIPDYIGPVRNSVGPDGKPRTPPAPKEPDKTPEKKDDEFKVGAR